PHWPPRSLSCSGADWPEAACGLDSADPAASLKGPGAVATVSSPLAIDALSTARRTLCYERAAARRNAVQLGEQVRQIGESHPGCSVTQHDVLDRRSPRPILERS